MNTLELCTKDGCLSRAMPDSQLCFGHDAEEKLRQRREAFDKLDSLGKAKAQIASLRDFQDFGPGYTARIAEAQVYATIAQAEQSKRVADLLDSATHSDGYICTHEVEW